MKILLLCLVVIFVFFFDVRSVSAQTSTIDKTIEELQKKISELHGQGNTLSKQIALLNSQIALTTLRISSIQSAIAKLTDEIKDLVNEVERLELLLTKRTELVLRRIPESYKRQVTPQFGVIFLSSNVFDFVSRVKYISTVQEQDAELLFQLKATQNNYNERKVLREEKRKQQETLSIELQKENTELDRQKKEKQALLDQTRNNEVVYQKLLAQALAEKQAIEKALVEGVKVGPVKKGDPIALVGNTGYPGCSTGAHLHFEIRKNNLWTNPLEYILTKTVDDEQNGGEVTVGSGNWDWPIADRIRMTQYFGKTPYSWRYSYSGGIHTGIDMNSSTSSVIKAPQDGTLYSSSQVCGDSSIIKIKYIDHGDGIVSLYLHVQ